jgi:hypothetical protein
MASAIRVISTIAVTFSLLACGGQASFSQSDLPATSFQVLPKELRLDGPFARAQLIVSQAAPVEITDRSDDLTNKVTYGSSDPHIAAVDSQGRLIAIGNGTVTITATIDGVSRLVSVTVTGVDSRVIDFSKDIRPILNKAGCAAAACHASQFGKGGFKLSVFGFDPQADFEAIARNSRQRRVNPASPDMSLLLRKPTMQSVHGGGKRFEVGSTEYKVLRTWIENGTPKPTNASTDDGSKVERIVVTPNRRVGKLGFDQQLRIEAHYVDGTTRDVTTLAKYDSMDEGISVVNNHGHVHTVGRGQAGVMIRYEGQAAIATIVVPYGDSIKLAGWKNNNYVDELAAEKFRELGLEPSGICDDATFLRRAFLDATGSLPTVEETRRFLESADSSKREKLVDQLLGLTGDPELDIYNDRYAAYWTLKWADLIRNNSKTVGEQGMWALHNWIRESFRVNKPFDKFVRELVTAKGSIYSDGPSNYFRINRDSSSLTESTAQLFMGVRLECAKCHHHPFENYSQADYYGLAAFFSRVSSKNSEEFGIFGRETIVMVRSTGEVSHPLTRKRMEPTPLGGEPIDNPLDRRLPLADWLTSADNEFFARSVVNRYTGYLLGRGLVEPIDDMRSTNPPSNAKLLDALAKEFSEAKFDLKKVMRTIMVSRLYQLSYQPSEQNLNDQRFYSHYNVKRLSAEPLLDAIDQATLSLTKFKNMPLGTRATELPDAEYDNYFLTTFAKPRRASVCECERAPDESLTQALHTLNGDILFKKITDVKGRVAKLLADKKPHEEIVTDIYLSTLCRFPTSAELKLAQQFVEESETPTECYQDLLWAIINSKHFVFVH